MPQPPAAPRVRNTPTLDIDDHRCLDLLAERALDLISTEQVLGELGVTQNKLTRFMGDAANRTRIARHLIDLRKSGELARWLSNSHLVDGVGTAHAIAENDEVHPSVRLKAVDTLVKTATNVGNQPSKDNNQISGPGFSLTINIGGTEKEEVIVNATPEED